MMIKQLEVQGVTVFHQPQVFDLVRGLNLIIGGNASGKSHLLKMAFTVSKWTRRLAREDGACLAQGLARDLERVFGCEDKSGVISQACDSPEEGRVARLSARFGDGRDLHVAWDAQHLHWSCDGGALPLPLEGTFIPPREVLSLYPCFAQIGRAYPHLLDGASWELCCALEQEPKVPIAPDLLHVKQEIEFLLGGEMLRRAGHFYLKTDSGSLIELGLLAEGYKRLATLSLLIANGSIAAGHMLCWDEAEMNLNICHMPALVSIVLGLCCAGVQVLLSTHSLFLLRELHLHLSGERYQALSRRFIVLQPHAQGVASADSLDGLPLLASLSAELEQADRYLSMGME